MMQLVRPAFTSSSIFLKLGRSKLEPVKPSSILTAYSRSSGRERIKSRSSSRCPVMLLDSSLSPSSLDRRR